MGGDDQRTREISGPRLFLLLIVFGAAFGYLEASVVVYLRRIYYPGGFAFPLAPLSGGHGIIESVREASTLVMLWAVATLAGRNGWERFGHFAFLFGVWDIAFYAGLRATIHWPDSLLTWDVLFLLPLVWTGPVLAPLLVSILLVAAGAAIAVRERGGRPIRVSRGAWLAGALSLALLLGAFLANHAAVHGGEVPRSFPWALFTAGLLVGAASAFVVTTRR